MFLEEQLNALVMAMVLQLNKSGGGERLVFIFFLLSQEAFVFLTVNIVGNREVKLSLTPLLLESFIN